MLPEIKKRIFGWIKVGNRRYNYDIVIQLDGSVRPRNKKLSKAVFGTSHKISITEAYDIIGDLTREVLDGAAPPHLLIGSGLFNRVHLSEEAAAYLQKRGVEVMILPTRKAVKFWNAAEPPMIGLFHISC